MEQKLCSVCKFGIIDGYNFCPNCGTKLKDIDNTVSVEKQIGVYLLSFFLPPLGLFPGFKYLKNPDDKVKHVGLIAIFLTLLSTIISIWLFVGFINKVNT